MMIFSQRGSALLVGAYRSVLGVALAAHFVEQALETVPWISETSLFGAASPSGWPYSWLSGAPPPLVLRGIFISCAFLGVLAALGLGTRLAASVLYAVAVLNYWAILPLATLDDYIANLGALMLLILPSDQAFRIQLGSRTRAPQAYVVPRAAVIVLAFCVLCLYAAARPAGLVGWDTPGGNLLAPAFQLLAVALVASIAALRVPVLLVQISVHIYLLFATSLYTTNIVLAGTGVLFWGQVPWRGDIRMVVDGGTVVCVALLVFVGLGLVYRAVDRRPEPSRVLQLASSIGVFPAHGRPPPAPHGSLIVRAHDFHGQDRVIAFRTEDVRSRMLVSRLASMDSKNPMVLGLATAAARRYCQNDGYSGQIGTLVFRTSADRQIIEFECADGGELAHIR
jgi:hypothetical protein